MLFHHSGSRNEQYPFHCTYAALLGFWGVVVNIKLLSLTVVLGEGGDTLPPTHFCPFFLSCTVITGLMKQMRILQLILSTAVSFYVHSAICDMLLYVLGIKHVPAVAFSNLK